MTPYELGIFAARYASVPGHLKQAYAKGFAGAMEKRAKLPTSKPNQKLIYQQGSDGLWYIRCMHNWDPETGMYEGISTLTPKSQRKLPEFTTEAYTELPAGADLAK